MPLPPLIVAIAFDSTINLGTIIEVSALVAAIVGCYHAVKGQVDTIRELLVRDREDDQRRDEKIEKLEDVVNTLAATTQRIVGNIESRNRVDRAEYWESPEQNRRRSPRP